MTLKELAKKYKDQDLKYEGQKGQKGQLKVKVTATYQKKGIKYKYYCLMEAGNAAAIDSIDQFLTKETQSKNSK